MHLPIDGAIATPARRRRSRLLDSAAAALGCAALLGVLLALVASHWGPLARLDRSWVDALHGFARGHTAWTASMQMVSDIGGPATTRIVLGVAAVWLWMIGARMLAGWAAAQLLLGWLAGWGGKILVDRARPHFADPVSYASGAAFPSGHAMASAITGAALVILLWPHANRAGRAVACTVAALAVLIIGWTRIALGVHWPSDVLAGWLAAGLVVAGVTVAVELWRPGALNRDVRRIDRHTRPRVQRVLASGETGARHEGESATSPDGQ
ncbi:phosphatase PAP2 family protein [Kitasatospora sp. HPMI-4]|uniref:phosphatase PAP2 family protein n=1 Tax=Kitasatospora sp. HPMI-4 TaxID=3448443 RepID=UPI003F1DD424